MGVNLIYLILGGEFLAAIAKLLGLGGSVQFWQILFWFAGAVTVLYGLKFVAKVEAVATWILVASMLVIILLSFNFVDRSQLSVAHWNQLLVPFGIFLFSLSGISVIAETVDLTKRKRKDAWRAVTVGTLAAAFLSWMFGVLLSLASGGQIGRNPADLIAYLPLGWGWLIPVFGFFAIATSFITTAQDLKAMLHLDFKLQKRLAWVLALFTPLILFFFYRDFLSLIDIVGTVFSAIAGILVACIAMRVLRRKPNISLVWASVIPLIVIAAYAIGMLHQFWYRPSV
jgi:purine-cytosine permease-like protein